MLRASYRNRSHRNPPILVASAAEEVGPERRDAGIDLGESRCCVSFRRPRPTEQLHQVLYLDTLQRAHRILDLLAQGIVYAPGDQMVELINLVRPGKRMRREAREVPARPGGQEKACSSRQAPTEPR